MGRAEIPAVLSSFVGRNDELGDLAALSQRHRLVSLVGPGGVGKTRLVLEWLNSVDADVAGFVDLGSLPNPALLPAVVLRACGISEGTDVDLVERIVSCLEKRDAILVLDTCEHVQQHASSFVDTVLRRCPSLRVIATSRVALGVVGEAVLSLSGLAADGVALFVDRLRLVQPGISVDESDARAICELADGLPLGIELAAAHARAMSLSEIHSGMADRMSFLSRRGPADADRHLSVEASIGWSYDLLDEHSKRALRSLSMCPGSFTYQAAKGFVGVDVSALEPLVDHSVVQFDVHDNRYWLLDTVREYAMRELRSRGEWHLAGRQLVSWAAGLAEEVGPDLAAGNPDALHRVQRDEHGIEAALEFAIDSGYMLDTAAEIVTSLTFYWSLRGRCASGARWATRVAGGSVKTSPGLMWSCAFLAAYSGDVPTGLEWAQQVSPDVCDEDLRYHGRALIVTGMIGLFYQPSTAIPVLTDAVEIVRRCADRWAEVEALQMLAYAEILRNDPRAAQAHLDTSLGPLNGLGHTQLRAWDASARADVACLQGRFDDAVGEARRGIALAHSIGEPVSASGALRPLVTALCQLGRDDDARREISTAETSLNTDPALMNREIVLAAKATAVLWQGTASADAARTAWTAAAGSGLGWLVAETGIILAQAQLADGDAQGAQATADTAIQSARDSEAHGAECAANFTWWVANRFTGSMDAAEASGRAHAALQTAWELGLLPLVADGLDVVAGCAVDTGRAVAAAQLHAASDRLRAELFCVPSPLVRQFRGRDERAISVQLSTAEHDQAHQQGAQLTAERAVAFAARSRGRRRRPRHGWDSLTPTEVEVSDLVSRGLSNSEIGTALLITEGTVRTHLRSIFAKLGFRSRSELAAEAVRRRD